MASLFSKIVSGDIPCYKVAETEEFLAFLDIYPNAKDQALYLKLMDFSRTVAMAIEKAVPCQRVGMTVIGLEVPHAHVHLIPLNGMEDAQFIKKEPQQSPEDFQATATAIANQL